MTKGIAIKSINFIQAMVGCKDLTFGTVRHLTKAYKQFNEYKTEFDELQKIEVEDKEKGLEDFLKEEVEFTTLDVDFFNNVNPRGTGLFFTNPEGEKVGEELTFVDVAAFLEELKVIQ
jgi:hypothetical protein